MPLFVLEARQLTSDAPLIATLALALGGLGRFAWPPDGQRRARDLADRDRQRSRSAIYAGGALLGFVLPVLAIVAALVIGYGLEPNASTARRPTAPGRSARRASAATSRPTAPLGASTLQPGARARSCPSPLLGVAAVVAAGRSR